MSQPDSSPVVISHTTIPSSPSSPTTNSPRSRSPRTPHIRLDFAHHFKFRLTRRSSSPATPPNAPPDDDNKPALYSTTKHQSRSMQSLSLPPHRNPLLSPTSTSPRNEPQPTVFARFQALLPHSNPTNASGPPPASPNPKHLTVKVVSWNMHDSIPKGDLDMLLGVVPPYTPPSSPNGGIPDLGESDGHPYHIFVVAGQECPSVTGLPMAFGAGYKVSAVLEKDKEKRVAKKKRHESSPPMALASPPLSSYLNTQKRSSSIIPQVNVDASALNPSGESPMINNALSAGNLGLHTGTQSGTTPAHPGGWSGVLEDWLVRGIQHASAESAQPIVEASVPSVALPGPGVASNTSLPHLSRSATDIDFSTQSLHALTNESLDTLHPPPSPLHPHFAIPQITRRTSGASLHRPSSIKPSHLKHSLSTPPSSYNIAPSNSAQSFVSPDSPRGHRGPYELVAKERMMGIYLAVYVHRDVLPLVQGSDKHAVAAGLIGGRVGNKGGVGISLKVAGTSFLFLNAHLAAHEGREQLRMANLAKIKAELTLDTFLESGDPRLLEKDITDRFDHTFLCGDLNFRLNMTRLHADWLIAQKDYQQALVFDQLRDLMRKGEFPGFQEGPIDFPPTFKYDVQRFSRPGPHRQLSVRQAIHKTRKVIRKRTIAMTRQESDGSDKLLNEVVEITEAPEEHALSEDEEVNADVEDDEVEGEDGEGDHNSVASHSSTICDSSALSAKYTEEERDDDDSGDEEIAAIRSIAVANTVTNAQTAPAFGGLRAGAPPSPVDAFQKFIRHPTIAKAKAKWLAFVAPTSSPKSPTSPSMQEIQRPNHVFGPTSRVSKAQSLPLISASEPSVRARTPDLLPPPSPWSSPPKKTSSTSSVVSSTRPHMKRSATSQLPGLVVDRDISTEQGRASDDEPDRGVYDSSTKQRVPSWCDRIIWKSNVIPDRIEDPEELPSKTLRSLIPTIWRHRSHSNLSFTRSNLHSFPRTDSLTSERTVRKRVRSLHTTASQTPLPVPAQQFNGEASRLDDSLTDPGHGSLPDFAPAPTPRRHTARRPKTSPESSKRPSLITTPPTVPPLLHDIISPSDPREIRNPSISSSPDLAGSSFFSNTRTSTSSTVLSPVNVTSSPTSIKSARRWRLFPHSHRTSTTPRATSPVNQTPHPNSTSSTLPTTPAEPKRRRDQKGDVEVLSYGTLDDVAMAALRGRSDHRPIIGVYSICV